MNTPYGPNAFNSLNFQPQKLPPAHSQSRLQVRLGDRLLGFQRPGLATCSSALETDRPEEYKNAQNKDDSYWNEHSLTVGSANTWFSILYYYLYACGMVIVFIIPPLVVLANIVVLSGGGGWHETVKIWSGFGLYAWLPSFVIWLSYKMFIWDLIDPKWMMLRPRRVFSLQRTTGMVQLFDKNDQLTFEAPFIEFDALLSTVYNQYGIAHYNLDLVHRYSTSYQGLSLGGAIAQNTHPEEHLRLWCMIQRYMDTSQSMPDILPLEAGRPHDPVTIAYDRERGRPERFWRDLSQDEYKRLLHKSRYLSSIRYDLGEDIDLFVSTPIAHDLGRNIDIFSRDIDTEAQTAAGSASKGHTHPPYGKEAFNSQSFTPQEPPPTLSRTQVGEGDRLLGFQRPGLAVCTSVLERYQPETYKKSNSSWWNEKTMTMSTQGTWISTMHYALYIYSIILFFGSLATLILMNIIALFSEDSWHTILAFSSFFGLYIGLPTVLVWLSYKLFDWGILDRKWKTQRRYRLYSLQRATGMVQLFYCDGTLRFEAPFIEFDALLSTVSKASGSLHYKLELVHRYSETYQDLSLGSTLGADNTQPEEHQRLWCMIQRYMDTSQSMPDILPLEAGRPNDPVTLAYDRARGRPERFWRDLSYNDYQQLLRKARNTSATRDDLGEDIDLFANYCPAQAAVAKAARDAKLHAAEQYARKQRHRNTPW